MSREDLAQRRRVGQIRICRHRAGSPAAIRVTSRTPWPERARWRGSASSNCPATSTAIRCGRWEVQGDRAVVLARRDPDGRGAARSREQLDGVHRLVRGRGMRGDRPRAAVEQRGAGGERAGALAAGHRVAADVVRERLGTDQPADPLHERPLHAPDVGDQGPGCQRLRHDLRRWPRRHGHDHDAAPSCPAGRARRHRGRRPCARCPGTSLSQTSTPTRASASPIEVPSSPAPTTWIRSPIPFSRSSVIRDRPARGSGRCAASRPRAGRRASCRPCGSSDSTWASSRTTRGIEPSISSSRAHSSGISPKPSWRAAYAGNSACRSPVAVNMTLMKSSTSSALASITASTSSATRSSICSRVSVFQLGGSAHRAHRHQDPFP